MEDRLRMVDRIDERTRTMSRDFEDLKNAVEGYQNEEKSKRRNDRLAFIAGFFTIFAAIITTIGIIVTSGGGP